MDAFCDMGFRIMEINEIRKRIMEDPRNASYTARGIEPILQFRENARILLVGQAPGRKVEESGIPFHDKSGDTLMQWMGIGPESFYGDNIAIVPMDFYYPGKGKSGDLPPRKFMTEYHDAVVRLMPNVRLTVLIGKFAADHYLSGRSGRNLTETVRHYQDYLPEYFPIVHPSPLNVGWQKKNPWFREAVVPDLQKRVAAILGE